jgi:hypothetical protein
LRPTTTEKMRRKSEQVIKACFATQTKKLLTLKTARTQHHLLDKTENLLLNKTDRFLRDLLFKQKFWMLFKSDQIENGIH